MGKSAFLQRAPVQLGYFGLEAKLTRYLGKFCELNGVALQQMTSADGTDLCKMTILSPELEKTNQRCFR